MRSYGAHGMRVRASATLALAALGITLTSPLVGYALASSAGSDVGSETATSAATPNASPTLQADSSLSGRPTSQRLVHTRGRTVTAASSADTPNASARDSVGYGGRTGVSLQQLDTVAPDAVRTLQRFASRASRTRGQPVTA